MSDSIDAARFIVVKRAEGRPPRYWYGRMSVPWVNDAANAMTFRTRALAEEVAGQVGGVAEERSEP